MIGWTFFVGAMLALFGDSRVAGFTGVGLMLIALGMWWKYEECDCCDRDERLLDEKQ